MPFPYYTATPAKNDPADLKRPQRLDQDSPEGYDPESGLVDAVNVALIIGRPLLITGQPGTGKTQLATSVAWQLGSEELGNDKPIKFETKTTSKASELFYTYDHLRRFRASQDNSMSQDNKDYVTYTALGKAILLSHPRGEIEQWVKEDFEHKGACRSVVLIDEIDKAPRDFPNDILNEIDAMYFRVPELHPDPIKANPEFWPVVILTSNSEKNLPDAFLRRCVYYHIPFPNPTQMATIVKNRIKEYRKLGVAGDSAQPDANNTKLLNDALKFFYFIREQENQLYKTPATAELLNWLTAMLLLKADVNSKLVQEVTDAAGKLKNVAKITLSALIKNSDDQNLADLYLKDFLRQTPA